MSETVNLKADPAELRVIKAREDGSGVVEIPLIPVTPAIDFGKTAGGGGSGAITLEDLREMVANFDDYPGPVSVGTSTHNRDTGGPAPGFLESVTLRGEELWGRLDLGPALFREVVVERAWRGFSIEASRNLKKPTREFKGWVLTGGIFTNQPATNVHYRIAASAVGSADVAVTVYSDIRLVEEATMEATMSDEKTISLATHEAKLAEERSAKLQDQVMDLRAEIADLGKQLDATKTDLAGNKVRADQSERALRDSQREGEALRTRLTEVEANLREERSKGVEADVRQTIEDAIAAGVPPAVFGDWEDDPSAWVESNYASVDAFKSSVTRLMSSGSFKGSVRAVKSGHDPKSDAEKGEAIKVTEDEATILNQFGGTDFVGVTNEAEFKQRLAAKAST